MSLHLLLPLALLLPVAPSADATAEEFVLDNGIRVTLVAAEHAEGQSFFTLLPLGLLDDDVGRSQFAHLVEHLAIRSTDPEEQSIDGVLVNGETTALALRADTLAPRDRWREALARHPAWLTASAVDDEVLEREKARIVAEVAATGEQGYTHKWALAAWNQVVRHGATHVGVLGDVAGSSPAVALEYLRDRLRPGAAVRLVSVGPVPFDELRPAITAAFEGVPGRTWRSSAASVPPERLGQPAQHTATWDLPGAHYLEWYPVPAGSDGELVAADALALLINVRLQQHGSLAALGCQALAAADLVTPEGRWLLVTVSLPEGTDAALALGHVRQVVDGLHDLAEAPLLVAQMADQLGTWPDFAAVRQEYAGQPGLEWIESQQVLFRVYAELNTGLDRRELLDAYRQLGADDLVAFAARVIDGERRSSLLLTPRPAR